MKTPFLEEEIRSGTLLEESRRRMAEGKLSELDFEVAQILAKINERYNLSSAGFSRAIDLGRAVVILTTGPAGVLIGKNGKVVGELSSALGKKVRIVEAKGDARKSVADVIMPARLLGINSVYHDGKEKMKVRIARADSCSLPMDVPTLERALCSLLGPSVEISFE